MLARIRPAHALREAHLDVWYDEFTLELGDSLRREIDRGLATSQFGIVVLSPAFFAKRWTNYELDGLVQLHGGGSNRGRHIFELVTDAAAQGEIITQGLT
jgi:hypothetical protein